MPAPIFIKITIMFKSSIESRLLPKFNVKDYIKLNNDDIIKKGDVVKHDFMSDIIYVENSIGRQAGDYSSYTFYRLKNKTIRKII